jgi:hypothetical protein
MVDDFIHHGAEIALLRDLWTAQQSNLGAEGGVGG